MSENITNNTQVYAIFGDPVEHSKSPQMHNSAFEFLNIDAVYKKHHLKDGKKLKEEFLNNLYSGANITVPHKEQAFKQADEVVGIANEIQAVNTYIKKDKKVIAYNTDAPGFLKAIESFKDVNKVLVLGAGGTAKAIALALQEKKIDVTVVNRSDSKLEFFKQKNIKCFSWKDFRLDYFDLVVNSTSAGLKDENLPMNKAQLENVFLNSKYAFDCVYGKETAFLKLAKKEGLKTKDGEDMLLYQGLLAFELFTNTKADNSVVETMRKGLRGE
ncbi:shikimate dehydrogenase [Malaciobacter halophilus]|uniref:Shikimate dehydrogenase (NADP(+)) n=1 Tax=Malaciobacter halophilus TaxID=197482 RepID=A0A2N1J2M1_9BACT|nr:shikimate dehydrogenase [Malaciobacter halophilus]AXH09873.1 shikimate dehydrogenase [Malaciobacter halophilus]PKI80803.1 shikimate dehydrogenase [Malaciobacter halophilus]